MRKWGLMLPLLAAVICVFAPRAEAATIRTLHDFCSSEDCADGRRPFGVAVDAQGRIYGTAVVGGVGGTGGVVYMLESNGDAWNYTVLHSFCRKKNCKDGGSPVGNLVIDGDGSLYGVTQVGGRSRHREGSVFRLSPDASRKHWKLTLLHSFCNAPCHQGQIPPGGLSYVGQNNGRPYDGVSPLYGLARGGRDSGSACNGVGCSLVYKLVPQSADDWKFSVVYRFCPLMDSCPDGWNPIGNLLPRGSALMGTTTHGGLWGSGTLFKLTKKPGSQKWNEDTLHDFCANPCQDGSSPEAGLASDTDGVIYGTTGFGIPPFSGSLFKIASDNTETTLYRFCALQDCRDGNLPLDILLDAAGDIYGITEEGGGHDIDRNAKGGGTLYKMSGGTLTTLWQFCSAADCTDGEYPAGQIILSHGKLYGTTTEGGAHGAGLVYELTP